MTSAFRLRKKRGSFRLRKRDPTADDRISMNYLPLSYLDTYYALGKRRSHLSDEVPPLIPTTLHDGDDIIDEEKRASFRLKKIPQNAVNRSAHGAKRASFRLKRILDNYKDLLGSPSGSLQLYKIYHVVGVFTYMINFIFVKPGFYEVLLNGYNYLSS
jgi:hypothetical protein